MKEEIGKVLVRLLNVLDLETNYVSGIRSQIIKSSEFEKLKEISDLEQSLLRLQDEVCYILNRMNQEE